MSISSLAYIHPDAKIAEGVTIEPFSTIYHNVEIGEGTWIGPHVTIMEGARIGKNCKIFPGAVVSGPPQDLKFKGEDTVTIIGDNTVIREAVTISRGTADKFKTEVGSDCLLMAYVHVAHDCIIGDHCIFSNGVQLAGHVEIEDFVIIGGTTAVHQFARIGAHAFVAGGSLVRKDIPPFVKAAREPLAYCGINSVGLKRRGFDSQQIAAVQNVYRNLFMKGLNYTKAIEAIEQEQEPSAERDQILQFVKASSRGLLKGYGESRKGDDD